MEKFQTMATFVSELADEIHKQKSQKNNLSALGQAFLVNAFTLPLGIVSLNMRRSKAGHEATVLNIFSSILRPFSVKPEWENLKSEYLQILDHVSSKTKMRIVSSSITAPEEYMKFVESLIPELNDSIETKISA